MSGEKLGPVTPHTRKQYCGATYDALGHFQQTNPLHQFV